MSGRLHRFLGDSLLRVVLRLGVLSFIVGLVLSVLNIRPYEIFLWLERLVGRIYAMGFGFLRDALEYLALGALIVVPLFLLLRLLKLGGRSRGSTD
ncbi:MAG: integrase [Rhizobiales bacterium]|nr:integrase [Hyphomicrobiales bacterium]